jgi:error-prone DNA polymerase
MPPLFRGEGKSLFREPAASLPRASAGQEVVQDYRATGLTLRSHPLTFLRSRLRAKRVLTAIDVKQIANEKVVNVAGLVLFRQQPQTAKGTIFLSLEDETGVVNIIVWNKVHAKYRQAVYGGKLLVCQGVVQREGQVLHVIARNIWDWTHDLRRLQGDASGPDLPVRSRDFH